MRNDIENIIATKSFEFAELLENQRKFVIVKQILKRGTSIGANIREAQNAESKANYSTKNKVFKTHAGNFNVYGIEVYMIYN